MSLALHEPGAELSSFMLTGRDDTGLEGFGNSVHWELENMIHQLGLVEITQEKTKLRPGERIFRVSRGQEAIAPPNVQEVVEKWAKRGILIEGNRIISYNDPLTSAEREELMKDGISFKNN